MSLQNMPEDKYNGIFKDAADKINFEFNDAAWSKMEQKLDRKKPAFFTWYRLKIPALIAAIFVGGILIVNFSQFNLDKKTSDQDLIAKSSTKTNNSKKSNSESIKEKIENENQSAIESKKNNVENSSILNNEVVSEEIENKKQQLKNNNAKNNSKNIVESKGNNLTYIIDDSQNARKKQVSDEEKTLKNKEKDTFYLGEDIAIVKNAVKNSANDPENNKKFDARESTSATNIASIASIKASAKDDQKALAKEQQNNSNNNNGVSNSNNFQPIANEFMNLLLPIPIIYPLAYTETLEIKNNSVDNSKIKLPKISKNKFAILAMISPDFTYNSKFVSKYAGANYGIAAEYYFIKNASISLGVNRAMKKYHIANNPYEFEGWISPYAYPAKDVFAKCLVIDVPVTFKYYLFPSSTGKLFVGAGVSSYFMRSESYDFLYKTQYGEENHHFDAVKRKNHYLSVYNLSLGFEKTIYKNLSIQLEPFVKIPGTGIGTGSIKLQTSGMFFSLKHRF